MSDKPSHVTTVMNIVQTIVAVAALLFAISIETTQPHPQVCEGTPLTPPQIILPIYHQHDVQGTSAAN